MQIGKPQANALKSIEYMDTVLFLTTGKHLSASKFRYVGDIFSSGVTYLIFLR
jgi:hypothetical protein